jgi:hypothetical protein
VAVANELVIAHPRGQTVATLLLVLVVIVVRERDATASRLLAHGRA